MIRKIYLLLFCLIIAILYYKYSPYRIELLGYYDKVWAHRVNSLEKLESAVKYYEGVELDLVYNKEKNFFDVNHPPAKSIELTFKEYLKTIKKGQVFLWLDIKNLKESNAKNVLDKLDEELKINKYPKSKILIETRFPEALSKILNRGYKASYYLPYGLNSMGESELKKVIESIRVVLVNNPGVNISAGIEDYTLLKQYFPFEKKYLWSTGSIVRNNLIATRNALNDPTVSVVLVTHRSLKGNR